MSKIKTIGAPLAPRSRTDALLRAWGEIRKHRVSFLAKEAHDIEEKVDQCVILHLLRTDAKLSPEEIAEKVGMDKLTVIRLGVEFARHRAHPCRVESVGSWLESIKKRADDLTLERIEQKPVAEIPLEFDEKIAEEVVRKLCPIFHALYEDVLRPRKALREVMMARRFAIALLYLVVDSGATILAISKFMRMSPRMVRYTIRSCVEVAHNAERTLLSKEIRAACEVFETNPEDLAERLRRKGSSA